VALNAEALDRRSFLAGSAGAAAFFGSSVAQAADFPGLPAYKGNFERDPNEKLFVGDNESPAAVKAKTLVETMQVQAQEVMDKMKQDPQTDLTSYIGDARIGQFRLATNLLDELLDDSSAAGVQRLQRLMIGKLYIQNEEGPFPISKKGVVQPRGPVKADRFIKASEEFVNYSKQYLKFFEA